MHSPWHKLQTKVKYPHFHYIFEIHSLLTELQSALADKAKCNFHFPTRGKKCINHHQMPTTIAPKIIHTNVQICSTPC